MYTENELTEMVNSLSVNTPERYNLDYVDSIKDVLESALRKHKRLLAIRFDLRYPADHQYSTEEHDNPSYHRRMPANTMSRFIDSFKSKISADLKFKRRNGIRIYGTGVFYIWCCEQNTSDNEHYHVSLLLNHDEYHTLGQYGGDNLSGVITDAWMSATGITKRQSERCVYFSGEYHLKQNKEQFSYHLIRFFDAACYLAKKATKQYGSRRRNFGTSMPFRETYLK